MSFRQFRRFFKDEVAFQSWLKRKDEMDPQTLRKNLLAAEEAAKKKPKSALKENLKQIDELIAEIEAERQSTTS